MEATSYDSRSIAHEHAGTAILNRGGGSSPYPWADPISGHNSHTNCPHL